MLPISSTARRFRALYLSLGFWLAGIVICGMWSARADVLVSTNSPWRYFKGTREASDPSTAWREIAFDDSAWLVGDAPFHCGSNPACGGGDDVVIGGATQCVVGGTILSDMRSNYTCIFLRRTFVVTDTNDVAVLKCNFYLDDGVAYWINGKAPRNPVGLVGLTNVAYTNIASIAREATSLTRQDISVIITNLVNGTNVLCVQAFNVNLTNDDFRIDVELVTSELLPFPLAANQRGTVSCLENPTIAYDVYLPPAYSTDGNPLPIIYTLNPDGGGMVSQFQAVCSALNIIAVGVIGSRNGAGWDTHFREFFAVSRDVRQRVLFDPTAEFAGGFSGGGESAYFFSRFRGQHVAGVFEMAGWLGRTLGYYSTDRVQSNLLVARATGTTDTAANFYILRDSNVLAAAGAVIQDWYFTGGHQVAPDSLKSNCLSWLVSQRIPAGPTDRADSITRAADWRLRLANGDRQSVLRECVNVLMSKPRAWDAFQAQLILDRLATNYTRFRSLDVTELAQGDFALDLFYYYGRCAALAGDLARFRSSFESVDRRYGRQWRPRGRYSRPAPAIRSSGSGAPMVGRSNAWRTGCFGC